MDPARALLRFCLLSLALASALVTSSSSSSCVSQSQPNPISGDYPDAPTGTINGTNSILPVDYLTARSILPSQYTILRRPWKALFPELEAQGLYPENLTKVQMLLQAVQDHDVREGAVSVVPDFSRAVLTLPFVDLLGDGYSSFRYAAATLVSADNAVALAGAAVYGPPAPIPGTFWPACEAYDLQKNGTIAFDGYSAADAAAGRIVATRFTPEGDSPPISVSVFRNLTNQPIFGNGLVCDNYVTLFNSSVTQGKEFAPVAVHGTVKLAPPFFPLHRKWEDIKGIKANLAFVEYGEQSCTSLKGYRGTGSGD